jgi:hypothetical protein
MYQKHFGLRGKRIRKTKDGIYAIVTVPRDME